MRILTKGITGTDVMEVQATLQKMGYRLEITGVYDDTTIEKVQLFQRMFGLVPDGIIGPKTWDVLERFLRGYDTYVVQPSDTIENITSKYNTDIWRILSANNFKRRQVLYPGMRIKVPYDVPVVDTNINYDYKVMQRDLIGLKARYPFVEMGTIGESVLGRNLSYIRLGKGPHTVMYNAAHHALEWITSVVMMKFSEQFLRAYVLDEWLDGFRVRDIWNTSSIYIVPMVNPDGIDLVLNGLSRSNPYYKELLAWNGGMSDFSQTWQANTRGIDLNHNYDAMWEESKLLEAEYGITGPGPTRFGGFQPESEPEVKAMIKFTQQHDPYLVLAYHSQGEVIYWTFNNMEVEHAMEIGEQFALLSGYLLEKTEGIASFSGYKDWFIKNYMRPGYTVEVGKGRNPLPIIQFDEIYKDNRPILLQAAVIR